MDEGRKSLTKEQVIEIKKMYIEGCKDSDIMEIFSVTRSVAANIRNGRNYTNIDVQGFEVKIGIGKEELKRQRTLYRYIESFPDGVTLKEIADFTGKCTSSAMSYLLELETNDLLLSEDTILTDGLGKKKIRKIKYYAFKDCSIDK